MTFVKDVFNIGVKITLLRHSLSEIELVRKYELELCQMHTISTSSTKPIINLAKASYTISQVILFIGLICLVKKYAN